MRDQLKKRRRNPPPAKFFMAVMVPWNQFYPEVEEYLSRELGPLEHRSVLYDFSAFSKYYDAEMGGRAWKYFVTFRQLLPMDSLRKVKLYAEQAQDYFAIESAGGVRRGVNLDPGYLTGWNLVLSTVKNHAHRLYLGDGIFAEVTLLFRRHSFQTLPWTYRDYSYGPVVDFFHSVRSDYLKQLRDSEIASMEAEGLELEF
jgi:hypothetical protein